MGAPYGTCKHAVEGIPYSCMNRLFTLFFWISIIISALSAGWFVLHNTIYFHTDIARDFLLIEDIVVHKKLTLIGPHSGGVDGVFHGPAWLYLNVPAFVLGKGNPVVVGWFWVVLMLFSIGIVYIVTKKLADTTIAMISTAFYGLIIGDSAANLFNPFGAVLLSPLYFYFFIRYLSTTKTRHLIIALLIIGFIIQFQMAWGVPILLLSLPLLLYTIITKKRFIQICSFAVLLIPLSTFILFDIRHQFLQMRSVVSYLSHPPVQLQISLVSFIGMRMQDMFMSLLNIAAFGYRPLQFFFFLLFVFFFHFVRRKKSTHLSYFYYFLYFYIGYWTLTLFYKGTMWSYYTSPFIPLFCIAIGFLFYFLPKKTVTIVFLLIIYPLLFLNLRNLYIHNSDFFKLNSGLWQFYNNQARTIFTDAGKEFGWYVYSADQYGYSPKYAMHYVQRNSFDKQGIPFEKKQTTYFIISPSTNRYTNEADWKKDKIKLTRTPNRIFKFQEGSYVEKYFLSTEELQVPSSSDLIQDLIFR